MRKLFFLAAFSLAFAVHAQQAANPGEVTDPATSERLRLDGVPGGTGAHLSKDASGGATVGDGDQHRHSPPKPPDPQENESRAKPSGGDQARNANPPDGGTGARVPSEANGGASVGNGSQHREAH